MFSSTIKHLDERLSVVANFVFFAALAGAPLIFGSRDRLTIAFWCLVLGIGLVCGSSRQLRTGHFIALAGLASIVASYLLVLHEQLSQTPWLASPNSIWTKASETLERHLTPLVSIVRDEPFYALGAPLSAVLALALGIIVGAEQRQARRALQVAAWAGAAYAGYGIFSLLFTPNMILWREKTAYLGDLTGTFINRNTAAAYFGSCAVLWLFLLMEAARQRLPRGPIAWTTAFVTTIADADKRVAVRAAMLFLCLGAMFLTSSRGGVLVSLLVLILSFLAYFWRDLPRGHSVATATFAAVAVALLLLYFIGGNVGYRIDQQGLADAGRLSAYRSTLRIIADHPWFGTGLGTFAWAFPLYRSDDISMVGIWDMAHSTPLQLASEVGLPLASLVGLGWIAALAILARGARGRRRHAIIPLSALMVSLIALLHSSIDFSLQISGYAIVAMGLLGVGLGQGLSMTNAAETAEGNLGVR